MKADQYCFDSVYDSVDGLNAEEYPYLLYMVPYNNTSALFLNGFDKFSDNFRNDLTLGKDTLSEFCFLAFTDCDKKLQNLSEMSDEQKQSLDWDRFKPATKISEFFPLEFSDLRFSNESLFNIQYYIKENSGTFPSIDSTTQPFGDGFLKRYPRDFRQEKDGTEFDELLSNNSLLLFDVNGRYQYMFDKKLERIIDKMSHAGNAKTSKVSFYVNPPSPSSNLFLANAGERFHCHVIGFKKDSDMRKIKEYCKRNYGFYFISSMSSYADDPINIRYSKVHTLSGYFDIKVKATDNKSMTYQVDFDEDSDFSYEDIMAMIHKEIELGTFYTDKKISLTTKNLFSVPIYINEEKFINKIKLMSKWKDAIKCIRVNPEV